MTTTTDYTPRPASDKEISEAGYHYWSAHGTADKVWYERERQLKKWGLQERASGVSEADYRDASEYVKRRVDIRQENGTVTWVDILEEEVLEAFAEEDPKKLRVELIQCSAVIESWLLDLERRGSLDSPAPSA